MTDTARQFFDRVVEPAIFEYNEAEVALTEALSGSAEKIDDAREMALRRACSAAVELHQFADRVLSVSPNWSHGDNLKGLRTWLSDTHVRRVNGEPVEDLEILHDVADAFKHAKLTRHCKQVQSDRAVVFLATGYGELSSGEGKYGGVEQVVVRLKNGDLRALSSVLWTVRDA
ncbi:MAG: hypothetical protein KDE32_05910 [Novosphingobium sp.]|nr:hypothetical protein [Novosphingobium sp.]